MRLRHAFEAVETGLNMLARASVMAMLVAIFVQVLTRHILRNPVKGIVDISEIYLLPMIVFMSLSYVERYGGHVQVEIIYMHLSGRLRAAVNVITYLAAAILFALICWASWQELSFVYGKAYRTSGDISFPLYTALWVVPVGAVVMMIRLSLRVVDNITVLVSGAPAVEIEEKVVDFI